MIFVDRAEYENKQGVYKIVNIKTGMVYIGKTFRSFLIRYFDHKTSLKQNKHFNKRLQDDYNKFGSESFEFVVIYTTENKKEASSLEQYYIKTFMNIQLCYNKSLAVVDYTIVGSRNRERLLGTKVSKQIREKMVKSRKGKARPDGTFERMVKTKSNQYLNGETNKLTKLTVDDVRKIKQAIMDNVSYEELAEIYNISYSNVNAIRSNRSWKFVEVDGWNEYCELNKRNRFKRTGQSRSAN